MTQSELFRRLTGNVPSRVTVRLLQSIPLPYDGTQPLDEVSFPGYAPKEAAVNQKSFGGSFPQAAFDCKADFYNDDTFGQWYVEGCAVFIDDAEGVPRLFGISPFDNRYIIPYGSFSIDISVSAQSFIGAA